MQETKGVSTVENSRLSPENLDLFFYTFVGHDRGERTWWPATKRPRSKNVVTGEA
jgi:hypothetical protein